MLVTKNESSRYLQKFIEHHNFFDDVFVYDDRSDDQTVELARSAGWRVVIRQEDEPSFMEHEGKFRFNSWKSFEENMHPEYGDWILSIDADEFIITESDLTIKENILEEIKKAEDANHHLIRILRREIWKMDETGCFLRVDGFWKNDIIYRLFKYKENGTWSKKPMGCGSAPTYVGMNGRLSQNLFVLHFGYTNSDDRQTRYDRYISLPDHGHNDQHIKSIIKNPVLKKYSGPKPEWVDREISEAV
jgi:glycosyltransferase involved in cell wall biosynthesis